MDVFRALCEILHSIWYYGGGRDKRLHLSIGKYARAAVWLVQCRYPVEVDHFPGSWYKLELDALGGAYLGS